MKINTVLKFGIIALLSFFISGCSTTLGLGGGYREFISGDNADDYYAVSIDFSEDIENSSYTVTIDFNLPSSGYPSGREDITINYLAFEDGTFFAYFMIGYVGDDWRFMDGDVRVKLDDKSFTWYDNEPYRSVLNSGSVLEIIGIVFDRNIVNEITSSNNMVMQYYQSPITISDEDFIMMKDFLSKYFGKTYNELEQIYLDYQAGNLEPYNSVNINL